MKKVLLSAILICTFYLADAQQVLIVDTFTFTGARDTFVVPSCADTVFIKAWGAQGGDDGPGVILGGLGGYSEGNLVVTPGDTLWIYVGGKGTDGPGSGQNCNLLGGFNGGGNTGNTCCSNAGAGAGAGGGASDVRVGGNSFNNRVIVAGAGSGAGDNQPGASGGGLVGANGGTYNSVQATGGTQSAGGLVGGHYTSHACSQGTNGSFGLGGEADGNDGGGGGAGWYGGGGGPNNGAGGGGSSYIGGVLNGYTNSGVRSGNGLIVLEYYCSTVGKEELKPELSVSLYPNPANNMVTLEFGKTISSVKIEVFDFTGKLLINESRSGLNNTTLDVVNLPSGVYLVKLSLDGESKELKFTKN